MLRIGLLGGLLLCICFGLLSSALGAPPQQCDAPNVLIVLDASAKLQQAGMLSAIQKQLPQVIRQRRDTVRFGLLLYTGDQASVAVPVGPKEASGVNEHIKKLEVAIQQLKPAGQPTLQAAMQKAVDYLSTQLIPNDVHHKDQHPAIQRRHSVWLLTTGVSSDGFPVVAVQTLRNLKVDKKSYSIPTYILGLGSLRPVDASALAHFAALGGTATFFAGQDEASLVAHLLRLGQELAIPQEQCNGIDDDCDGVADEGLVRMCQSACGGSTLPGIQRCQDGTWGACQPPTPTREVCDGYDNDCNGTIDDNLTSTCRTACGQGEQRCLHGDWTPCSAPAPSKEVCDGKDNDCDGAIDEPDSACPGGRCVRSGSSYRCQLSCQKGVCPAGFYCDKTMNLCLEYPCFRKQCPAGQTCVNKHDEALCVDLCQGVQCAPGLTCGLGGICVNCYHSPCPPGMLCKSGQCVIDRCLGVSCAVGQGCSDGVCFESCANLTCRAGYLCQTRDPNLPKGVCFPDPCAGVTCEQGRSCSQGQCMMDRCHGEGKLTCEAAQHCDPILAACVDDPCRWTRCPTGSKCSLGECVPGEPVVVDCPESFQGGCCDDSHCGPGAVCRGSSCVLSQTAPAPDGGVKQGGAGHPGNSDAGPNSANRYSAAGCSCSTASNTSPGMWLWEWLLLTGLFLGALRYRIRN